MSSLDGVNALGLSKEKRERRQYGRVQMSAFVISSNKSLGESFLYFINSKLQALTKAKNTRRAP